LNKSSLALGNRSGGLGQSPWQLRRQFNSKDFIFMKFDPIVHHRRSIRLKGYDYRREGGYFVTMVTQERASLFGEVVNGEMILNAAGEMAARWWLELPNKFPKANVDIFVVMPNHFHGIIFIEEHVGVDLRVDPVPYERGEHSGSPQTSSQTIIPQIRPNALLSQMIQWFKTMTTNEYIRGVKQLSWLPFSNKLWQRNYYEHIIRNNAEADRIARYIESNPARWNDDEENSARK
jgi:putative transposase